MSVLAAHRERVASLNEAMQQLQRMHDEAHDLWCRIVQASQGNALHRQQQIDAMHDEAYALADRITRLREQTFGEISHEARLLLTSSVESAHPSLIRPETTPLRGE
jgi:hypothetical protein